MTKTNMKIKNHISLEDKIHAINIMAHSYFQENESGETEYAPYLKEVGKVIAAAKYFIEGIAFDENESIYDSAVNDTDVKLMVNKVLSSPRFTELLDDVKDLVEYKKARSLAKLQNEAAAILAYKLALLTDSEAQKAKAETEALTTLNNWINDQGGSNEGQGE